MYGVVMQYRNNLDINIVEQNGHNCKAVIIATIEEYYARVLGFDPIPLNKNNNPQTSESAMHAGRRMARTVPREGSNVFSDSPMKYKPRGG